MLYYADELNDWAAKIFGATSEEAPAEPGENAPGDDTPGDDDPKDGK